MKKNSSYPQLTIRLLITYTIVFLLSVRTVAQVFEFRRIAAGADSGEIYISCYWYDPHPGSPFGGLFRSTDHGQTLSIQYQDIWFGGILYSDIYGDLLQGTLYGGDGLRVSHDYGLTWEFHDSPITYYLQGGGGSVSGEIYIAGLNSAYVDVLYHGTHFGDSLYLMNTQMDSMLRIEAGSLLGELYAIKYPYYGSGSQDTLGIAFSNDYGQSFSVNYIDTSIVQNLYRYTLTHGPDTGELYLIGRKGGDYQYHVLHSMDYGHTFSLQYITPVFVEGWDEFSFVAGREPGSFYILQYHYCATLPLHTCLEIHYSSDYGVTYTTYYHEMDSTYTGIPSISELPDPVSCFPNPAINQLTVKLAENNTENITIRMMDVTGRERYSMIMEPHQHEAILNTESLLPGIYFLQATTPNRIIGMKKVIVQ